MKLLIVEDELKLAKALKKGLEQERFIVDLAHTADDGLAQAMVDEHDLVILDRMLPGSIDGIKICQALREQRKHMPILLLTAKDRVKDRVEGLNAGADDYLVKPFSFEELLARVRALLRRPASVVTKNLQLADLSLNPQTFEVTRSGQVLQLSKTEFSLLEYLMRHPYQILSKDTIIQHVWDFDADILPNTVEVYMKYLRDKIDKPFNSQPLIQTVRGFGYKIGNRATT
jgi:DNA-binding response OmpR family regulator